MLSVTVDYETEAHRLADVLARAARQYWLATLSTAIVTRDMQTSFSCSLLMRTSPAASYPG
jgi:hypothetical protein